MKEIDHLRNLNEIHEERTQQLEQELKLVHWYIEVLEDGLN